MSSKESREPTVAEKRALRKLNLRIRHLVEEIEEAEFTKSEYDSEFKEVITKLQVELGMISEDATRPSPEKEDKEAVSTHADDACKKTKKKDPQHGQQEEESAAEEEIRREVDDLSKTAPPWMKRVYKQIAMETHPDRIKFREDLSVFEKADRKRYFESARSALQIQDGATLLSIAELLKIDADVDPSMRLSMLDAKSKRLKVQLSKITRSPGWVWGESHGRKDIRKKLLQGYCKIYKYNIPSDPSFFDKFLEGLDS